jgi:drug/metabolite transporter (DMT)-like permease
MTPSVDRRNGLLYVVLAVTMFSTSPVLTRWASELSPFVVTCLRMWGGAACVWAIGRIQGRRVSVSREDGLLFMLWGLVTALHFVFYIASLSYTTVAHSLSLVYTSPIWVSLFSWLLLKRPLPRQKWLGIGIVVLGMVVLTRFEPAWSAQMLLGDLLALGSAMTFGLYSTIGRSQRARYPLLAYTSRVYAIAGLWLLPFAALSFSVPQHPATTWLSIAALGIFPLAIGHTAYNAGLRHLHPTVVNIIATQEVTGGVLLSWWLLNERPSTNAVIGAAIMLIGVVQVVL